MAETVETAEVPAAEPAPAPEPAPEPAPAPAAPTPSKADKDTKAKVKEEAKTAKASVRKVRKDELKEGIDVAAMQSAGESG